jgi:hypothetical protein
MLWSKKEDFGDTEAQKYIGKKEGEEQKLNPHEQLNRSNFPMLLNSV